MLPDPLELIASVLTAWSVAWLMENFGVPPVPSTLAAMLVFAIVSGTYRRRWAVPPAGPRPEPGS